MIQIQMFGVSHYLEKKWWVFWYIFRLLLPYEKFLLAEQKKLLGIGSPKPNKIKSDPGEPSVSILQVSWELSFTLSFFFFIEDRFQSTLVEVDRCWWPLLFTVLHTHTHTYTVWKFHVIVVTKIIMVIILIYTFCCQKHWNNVNIKH